MCSSNILGYLVFNWNMVLIRNYTLRKEYLPLPAANHCHFSAQLGVGGIVCPPSLCMLGLGLAWPRRHLVCAVTVSERSCVQLLCCIQKIMLPGRSPPPLALPLFSPSLPQWYLSCGGGVLVMVVGQSLLCWCCVSKRGLVWLQGCFYLGRWMRMLQIFCPYWNSLCLYPRMTKFLPYILPGRYLLGWNEVKEVAEFWKIYNAWYFQKFMFFVP